MYPTISAGFDPFTFSLLPSFRLILPRFVFFPLYAISLNTLFLHFIEAALSFLPLESFLVSTSQVGRNVVVSR
jgi:hypothetical protein